MNDDSPLCSVRDSLTTARDSVTAVRPPGIVIL